MYSPSKPHSDVSLDLARFLISGKPPRAARRATEAREERTGEQRFLGRFLREQDGAIAAMSAVSLVAILGFSAFAVDLSHAYSERNLLQATAGAAALAAAPELPSESQAADTALQYVEAKMPAERYGTVLESRDVVVGNWDPESETWLPGTPPLNAVEVTTRRSGGNGNR